MNMIWISHEHKRPFASIRASCALSVPNNKAIDTPLTHYIQSILITFGSRFFPVTVVHWFCFVRFLCSQRNYIVDLLRVLLNWDLPKHVLLLLEATNNLSRLLADPIHSNDCLTVRIIYNWNWLLLVVISFSPRINNNINVGTSVFVSNFFVGIIVSYTKLFVFLFSILLFHTLFIRMRCLLYRDRLSHFKTPPISHISQLVYSLYRRMFIRIESLQTKAKCLKYVVLNFFTPWIIKFIE